jgi:hypothetical protein
MSLVSNEVILEIAKVLLEDVKKHGLQCSLSARDVSEKVGDLFSFGEIEIALYELAENRFLDKLETISTTEILDPDDHGLSALTGRLTTEQKLKDRKHVAFNLTYEGCKHFDSLLISAPTHLDKTSNDEWKPITIDDFDLVAKQSEELAKHLLSENGYVATRPEEANFISAKLNSFAVELRKYNGQTVWKRIKEVGDSIRWLQVTFEATSRIGELIKDFCKYLKDYL